MHLTIIGPGRLGRSLRQLCTEAGHRVDLVRAPPLQPGLILLTVPDPVIAGVAQTLPIGSTVLHCSGTTPVEVLRPHHPAGSFHPLMSFPGPDVGMPDLAGVPAAIAGDPEAIDVATRLAESLGMRPLQVPGDRRLYHAAAVMAGNFATVLLAEAARVLAAAGVPPEQAPSLLAPLALESLRNAAVDPALALTGPVARGDRLTLDMHLQALTEHGLHASRLVYEALLPAAERLADAQTEKGIVGTDPGAKV